MDVGTVLVVSVNEVLRNELLQNLSKIFGEEMKIEELVKVDNLDQALTKTILNDVALMIADLESLRLFTAKKEDGIKQELVRTLFKTPTILITRPENIDLLESALELGARSFLSLPLDSSELKRKLANQLPRTIRTADSLNSQYNLWLATQLSHVDVTESSVTLNAPIKPASQSVSPSAAVKPLSAPLRQGESVAGVKVRMGQGVPGHPQL